MPNNLISVVSINSTSFVTLNNKGFEKMLISNTGTTDLDFNLVYGDTRLVGETSVGSTHESFFFLKSIEIPVGTTLELDGYSPASIQKTDGTVLRKSRVVTSERDGQNKNFKKFFIYLHLKNFIFPLLHCLQPITFFSFFIIFYIFNFYFYFWFIMVWCFIINTKIL